MKLLLPFAACAKGPAQGVCQNMEHKWYCAIITITMNIARVCVRDPPFYHLWLWLVTGGWCKYTIELNGTVTILCKSINTRAGINNYYYYYVIYLAEQGLFR